MSALRYALALCSLLLFASLQIVTPGNRVAVRILSDGTVEPPGAPVRRVGDVYLLMEDVSAAGDGVLVERSGAILDGGGRLLRGSGGGRGVILAAANVTVKNLVVQGFEYGVYASGAPGCSIQGVTVEGGRVGVGLWGSPGCMVANSTVKWSMVGVYLEGSSSSAVIGNVFEGCGLYVRRSYGNRVEGNTVNGRPLVYLEGSSGIRVEGTVGQAVLLRCSNMSVRVGVGRGTVGVLISECCNVEVFNCTLDRNVLGIDVWGSSRVRISGCTVQGGEMGLRVFNSSSVRVLGSVLNGSSFCVYVDSSRDVVIAQSTLKGCPQAAITIRRSTASIVENRFTLNTRGIVIQSSEGVSVVGNAIWRNSAGVVVNASQGSTFSQNEFVENGAHVILEGAGPNSWSGNFWSDLWERGDARGPYALDEGNVDENPATAPSLVLPVKVTTPIGFTSGSGWYERGSIARISVWPSSLLLVRFSCWVDQRGNAVAHTPHADIPVDEPLVLRAVWSPDPLAISSVLLAALTLTALRLRLFRKKPSGK